MDRRLHPLFRPVQANGRVPFYRYAEAAPSPALSPYVACYWVSEPAAAALAALATPVAPVIPAVPAVPVAPDGNATGCGAVAIDRVLPDGCTDIIFEHDLLHGTCRVMYSGSFDLPFAIEYDPQRLVRKLGVRFFPGGAHGLLRLPLAEFAGGHIPLDQVSAGFSRGLAEAVAQAPTLAAKIEAAERALLAQLQARAPADDAAMKNALHRIFVTGGQLPVRDLAAAEAIGSRHLHRKFERWIGIGPKRFSEIVRFQRVLAAVSVYARAERLPNWSALAADGGFFDQAHLINEFKRFYGATPLEAAAEYRGMSDFSNPPRWEHSIMEV